jgi:fatty acid desaturase
MITDIFRSTHSQWLLAGLRGGGSMSPRRRWVAAIALALAAGGLGLFFGWGWLVAIGVAPLLISAAPCVLMCAFGLRMMRKEGGSCAKSGSVAEDGK